MLIHILLTILISILIFEVIDRMELFLTLKKFYKTTYESYTVLISSNKNDFEKEKLLKQSSKDILKISLKIFYPTLFVISIFLFIYIYFIELFYFTISFIGISIFIASSFIIYIIKKE